MFFFSREGLILSQIIWPTLSLLSMIIVVDETMEQSKGFCRVTKDDGCTVTCLCNCVAFRQVPWVGPFLPAGGLLVGMKCGTPIENPAVLHHVISLTSCFIAVGIHEINAFLPLRFSSISQPVVFTSRQLGYSANVFSKTDIWKSLLALFSAVGGMGLIPAEGWSIQSHSAIAGTDSLCLHAVGSPCLSDKMDAFCKTNPTFRDYFWEH